MSDVLFRTRDLLVRRVAGFSAAACVVTFDSFSDHPTLDRPGFGEHFLRSHGVDAVHVLARLNEWYQHPETMAAMAAVRDATAGYGRVVTYGASMGAYAAIRLAGVAGAGAALALAPQFSLLPHRAPFEYRWGAQAARQRDVWETALPLPELAEPYVLFDPLDLDSEHAECLGAAMRILPVRLRGAGHQVAGFLQDVGLLRRTVLDTCRGPLDVAELERDAWRLRRRSAQARIALAARARSPALRIAVLRGALVLAPDNAPVLAQLGLALGRAGNFGEALDAQRAALALEPGQPRLLIEHATVLAASGDGNGALDAVAPLAGIMDEAAFAALRARVSDRRAEVRPGRTTPVDPGPSPVPSAAPIRTAVGQVGYVLFGPYLELRRGRYAVRFAVGLDAGAGRPFLDRRTACVLDVTLHGGRTVLARRRLSGAALRAANGTVVLAFEMPSWTTCEFRVRATGTAALVVGPDRPVRRVNDPPVRGWARLLRRVPRWGA